MTTDESPKKFSPLFIGVFLIFGTITLLIGFQTFKLWQIRQNWSSVTGTVVKTEPRGWWDDQEEWRYYLKYEYAVQGKTYTGTRLHLKEKSLKRFTYLIRHFKKGDPITVWYQPDDPAQAVINTEYLRDSFALIMVFAGFLFMAGTMILKEKQWQRLTDRMTALVPDNYKGNQPLPESNILTDRNGVLQLNTGMSVFWSRGVPFLFLAFIALFIMMLSTSEINPGWTLSHYLTMVGASWGAGLAAGFLVKALHRKKLEINASQKMIREISFVFFKRDTSEFKFSDMMELKLHRDQWHITNTLRNWILYLHTRSRQSIFVCFRHRDIQPAHKKYLETIKTRIEFLVFGDPHERSK